MIMYVGNCSKQVQEFHFRLPENKKVHKRTIAIGGQIAITGPGFSIKEVDAIVAQHSIYGLIRVDMIDRTKGFFGTCYNIDNKIPVHKLQIAMDHNFGVLRERGKQQREDAAVVVNDAIERVAADAQAPLEVALTDVEMVEEESQDGKGLPEPDPVNQHIRVKREGEGGPKKPRRTAAPRQRRA